MTLTAKVTDVALRGELHSTASRSTPVPNRMGPPRPVRPGFELVFARAPLSQAGELSSEDAVRPGEVRRTLRTVLQSWGRASLAESTEIVATELVTNSLKHGYGPIRVRMYLCSTHLVVEVRDSSTVRPAPRHAGPDDETGRGLLLVRTLADTYGVSDDSRTTWCALELPESDEAALPTALHAPVFRSWDAMLPAVPESALRLARMNTRTRLTMWHWTGNVHAATEVVSRLVMNALVHGLTAPGRLLFRLAVTESGDLLIEVSDPCPAFPDSASAVRGEAGRGLWEVARLGGQVAWYLRGDSGKTVQARMAGAAVHELCEADATPSVLPAPDPRVLPRCSPAALENTDRSARHRDSSDPGDERHSASATAAS